MIPTGWKGTATPWRAPTGGSDRVLAPLPRVRAAAVRARPAPEAGRPPGRRGRAGGERSAMMLEKLEQYQDRGGSIWSWLATVAANKARDVERERARRGQALRGFALLSAPLLDAQAPGPGDERRPRRRRAPAGRRGAGDGGAEPALPARPDAAVPRGSAARRVRRAAGGQDRDVRRACCCARCARFASAGRRPSPPARPPRIASR